MRLFETAMVSCSHWGMYEEVGVEFQLMPSPEAGAPDTYSPSWEMLSDDDPGLNNDSPGAMIYTLMMRHPGYFGSQDSSLEFNFVAFWERRLSDDELSLVHRRFGVEFHNNG